jgi:IclR family acetate operon transcriptional repressor
MSGVRTAERTLTLVDLLVAAAPEPVRVADAARTLEVSAASASRLLTTLVTSGYAARTPDRRYTVGPKTLALATRWVAPLRRAVEPAVARLGEATGDAVGVAVLLGDQIAAIGLSAPAAHPIRGYTPAAYPETWTTAAGRSLLAALPEPHRSRLSRGRVDAAATAHARRGGIFAEHGEARPDLSCFALPLATGRGSLVSLMVMCDRDRPRRVDHDRVRRALRSAAEQLGTGRLGAT